MRQSATIPAHLGNAHLQNEQTRFGSSAAKHATIQRIKNIKKPSDSVAGSEQKGTNIQSRNVTEKQATGGRTRDNTNKTEGSSKHFAIGIRKCNRQKITGHNQ